MKPPQDWFAAFCFTDGEGGVVGPVPQAAEAAVSECHWVFNCYQTRLAN